MATIRITADTVIMEAELNETRTAKKILEALPIEARGNTWGDEIYFEIPVSDAEDDGKEVVAEGDLGYWPPGNAFCIFFGLTPASRGDEIRPSSAVNLIGRCVGNPKEFKKFKHGRAVKIERA